MATDLLPADLEEFDDDEVSRVPKAVSGLRAEIEPFLRPLASLKLTVTLFACAVFLVFTGTLAQARHDIWWVVDHYFRTPVAWIEWNVFFPPAWFADYPSLLNLRGSFPFPGGFLIGSLMAINLLAAHGLRFKIQTSGNRLWGGLAVIAVGCALTWAVIVAGPDKDGSQDAMPIHWITLWKAILLTLAGSCVGIAFALFQIDSSRKLERGILLGVGCALLTLLGFLLFGVDIAGLNPSAMRILWQLIKAESAALVLLVGCALAFRKRAGIVLLHAGVGLIMANELVVYSLHKEEQMFIMENESASYASDIRVLELAIVDPHASETHDDVVVVPEQLLLRSMKDREPLEVPDRNLSVKLKSFIENAFIPAAELERGQSAPEGGIEQPIQATAGVGVKARVLKMAPITGSDSGQKTNKPAAYVELFDSKSKESIGTYLVGVVLPPQVVNVDGRDYKIALRFERSYKPYAMTLDDVQGDMYMGSDVPKNYSSKLQLIDPTRKTNRSVTIRMNDPLRYGGETFYQSGFHRFKDPSSGVELQGTTLQIVSNFGWMIPYVACMVVITGMAWQFLLALTRFLGRRDRELQIRPPVSEGISTVLLPVCVVPACIAMMLYWSLPTKTPPDKIDFEAAGKLAIVGSGRVQPLDTLARNSLRMLSGREVFTDPDGNTHSAMEWLLDVAARPDVARNHRVIRIDSSDVQAIFKLDRRSRSRYSPQELAQHVEDFRKQIADMRGRGSNFTVLEKNVHQLYTRSEIMQRLADAFNVIPAPVSEIVEPMPAAIINFAKNAGVNLLPFPTDEELQADPGEGMARAKRWIELADVYGRELLNEKPPLIVPPPHGVKGASPDWEPYATAWLKGAGNLIEGGETNPYLEGWRKILQAYKAQNPKQFNRAVEDYASLLDKNPPPELTGADPSFEAWFNRAELFYLTQWWYVVAFCLVCLSWMTGWLPLRGAAFWLTVALFIIHTFALVCRMTISGRPPVTNLYSSALFIGWAGVLLGLTFESVYRRLGFGTAVAAIFGFATLIIAEKLSLVVDGSKGETIGVMQAVLDTQFWLATHVTCITLGYATTYIAGLFGLAYVITGVFTTGLNKEISKILARMTYGSVCFAMLFSFFGTVLGGLWADDSWGRFWGWDPKENGALIIVLWNALILHARWDGLVKDRGLALLTIGGNIVTSWSWFGVNQLGVGLHSYGFTEGVIFALGIFCLTQLAMIGIGLLPQKYWRSHCYATT